MPTGDLRHDGRGRHTTRHRQLLVLPGGALLVDTPGLRELQVWEGDLDSAFADIAELAARVPFQRLRPRVRARLRRARGARTGALDPDRWQNYLQVERELRSLEAGELSPAAGAQAALAPAGARDWRARRYGGKP